MNPSDLERDWEDVPNPVAEAEYRHERRWSPYDPDYLEWKDLSGRAARAGRTPGEQARWERDQADRIRTETRDEIVSELNERRERLHGRARRYRTGLDGREVPSDPNDAA